MKIKKMVEAISRVKKLMKFGNYPFDDKCSFTGRRCYFLANWIGDGYDNWFCNLYKVYLDKLPLP